ncbi:hypothetical protein IWQ47_000863 [Aquimarina sp. EL_43]|nr:hypothetical protein [Aquimarina sp. EL_35]MBG6150900.1 hypothetical protein [Aquimarina sp. EL_32]MBG6167793.1 hypothetical protein [Aquimarina sp. EL_43]
MMTDNNKDPLEFKNVMSLYYRNFNTYTLINLVSGHDQIFYD